jgi:hypothetical protein
MRNERESALVQLIVSPEPRLRLAALGALSVAQLWRVRLVSRALRRGATVALGQLPRAVALGRSYEATYVGPKVGPGGAAEVLCTLCTRTVVNCGDRCPCRSPCRTRRRHLPRRRAAARRLPPPDGGSDGRRSIEFEIEYTLVRAGGGR